MYGHPVLRRMADPIKQVTPEIRQLARDMIETMIHAKGIGLAAPQVGESVQLAVIDVSHDPDCVSYLRVNGQDAAMTEVMPLIFINPKMTGGKRKEVMQEGCLSFPDIRLPVTRPAEVTAELTLLDGRTMTLETDGLLARALQHETDHLHGILFIQRINSAAKVGLPRKLAEMKENL